jgi:hypothetical protein
MATCVMVLARPAKQMIAGAAFSQTSSAVLAEVRPGKRRKRKVVCGRTIAFSAVAASSRKAYGGAHLAGAEPAPTGRESG